MEEPPPEEEEEEIDNEKDPLASYLTAALWRWSWSWSFLPSFLRSMALLGCFSRAKKSW